MLHETILALATPVGESALALIRISGPDAITKANIFVFPSIEMVPSHQVVVRTIKDPLTKEPIDQVVVTLYRAPKSYTGEDMVEISCHGNMRIVERLLSLGISQGMRLAEPGEFTKRAYLHGKLDLVQSESVNDLIVSRTEASGQLALAGLKGTLSTLILELKKVMVDLLAHLEVNIEYPEYQDIEQLTHDSVMPIVLQLKTQMKKILDEAVVGEVLKQGLKTAIIGRTNVGKSSLLNALLRQQKAIVTDIEGTTRDIVEGEILLSGILLHIMDTAGIRHTTDQVEQIGVQKATDLIEQADIILLVLDTSKALTKEDQILLEMTRGKRRIIVLNKADLPLVWNHPEGIPISAKQGLIEPLEKALVNLIGFTPSQYLGKPLLSNARQRGWMQQAFESLEGLAKGIEQGTPLDLLSIDLQQAIQALKHLLGEEITADLDKEIFSRFCIGK